MSIQISKMVPKMVRHHDQDEREQDGSYHWDTVRSVLLRAFARYGAEIGFMKAAVRKELNTVWITRIPCVTFEQFKGLSSPCSLATQGTARLAQVRSRLKTLSSLKRLDGGPATWAARGSLALVLRRKKLDPGPSFINRARIPDFRDDRDTYDKTAGSIDVVLDYTNALRHCAEGDGNVITWVRALVATVCRASGQVLGPQVFFLVVLGPVGVFLTKSAGNKAHSGYVPEVET